METALKPLRADARRNREKIVEGARSAFAEYGLDAQMDEIARRAGVGVGTVYRHFPTKDALVAGLVEAKMTRMADEGREVLAAAGDDPWHDFETFIRRCTALQCEDAGLAQVTATQAPETFRQAADDAGLTTVGAALVERARAAGAMRADADPQDIGIVMCGHGAVLRSWGADAGGRFVELLLDGFRKS